MKQLYVILFFLFTAPILAQDWQWAKHYDGGNDREDIAHDLGVDGAGNIYVCNDNSYSTGGACNGCYHKSYLNKFDSQGNLLWKKNNLYTGKKKLVVDSTGNSYMVWGGRLIKFDSDGNEKWKLMDSTIGFASVALYPGGGVVASGVTYNQKGAVAFISANGSKIWESKREYYGVDGNVSVDKNGVIFYSGGYKKDTTIFNKGLCVRLNSQGNILSFHSIPLRSYAKGTTDGFYVLVAAAIEGLYGIEPDNFTYHLLKYELNGNILWHRKFTGGKYGVSIEDYTLDSENLFISGYQGGPIFLDGNEIVNGPKFYFFVMKLDAVKGQFISSTKAPSVTDMGLFGSHLYSRNNEVTIAGVITCVTHTSSMQFGSNVIDYSSFGSFVYSDLFLGRIVDNSVLGIKDNLNLSGASLKVYPNPSEGLFTVSCDCKTKNLQIKVANVLGQLVIDTEFKTISGDHEQGTIDLSGLSKGTYFIMVYGEDFIETKKFIIQ